VVDIVERLRAEGCRNGGQGAYAWRARELCSEAADEINRLREVLNFYAANHEWPNEGPWGVDSTDFGDVARAALKGDE
jgi:hypothetical protein